MQRLDLCPIFFHLERSSEIIMKLHAHMCACMCLYMYVYVYDNNEEGYKFEVAKGL